MSDYGTTYYYAANEYQDVIPETIRNTEAEAVAALCALNKCDEAHVFDGGVCIAKLHGYGTLFSAHGDLSYVRGFRSLTKNVLNPVKENPC